MAGEVLKRISPRRCQGRRNSLTSHFAISKRPHAGYGRHRVARFKHVHRAVRIIDMPIRTGSEARLPGKDRVDIPRGNRMNAAAAFVVSALAFAQNRFEGRKDRGATAVEYGLLVG